MKITPIPKIGLIIDYEKGKITDVSDALAEIITLGGKVHFSKGETSVKGIHRSEQKNAAASIKFQSLFNDLFYLISFGIRFKLYSS